MGKTVPVLLRVDRETKAAAEAILAESDLTLSEALDLFLRQVVAERTLPFNPRPRQAVSVRVMEAFLESSFVDRSEAEYEEPASRYEFEEERSLRRAVENPYSRGMREMTGVFRTIRPSVDRSPWWPEVD